ncbi:putative serine/threonine protein kinase [Candidatus Nitrososphaera gargensis Ga9.2]|uniref:non-specific serine/threonine protein kinase n=1 Tax=Nitrososphaera gargensis (strain Ga9.2) TaxID=1237085 RepID=K0IMB5_NITGG|nr:serine/threonine-protein kinase [Candidatus Nitrososphaera gargensis]AFU57729.1 putative serine/threonine protein kinase [Candidatus Nitrososphaera gargensis Ga9.2]
MKYKIIEKAGSGGFGNVYKVEGNDGNIYAMKLLKDLNAVNKQRFDREIKILAQLDHPNIVKIVEWNLGGDPPDFSPWYTMEYLRGGSLRQHMDEKFRENYVFQRNWTIKTVILPILHAFGQAHHAGIYHRDLKPDNILYTDDHRAQIKITDWGLGRDIDRKSLALTAATGEVGGTPGYCAPEQWFSLDNIDGRADIFSLGVIFYEMMTGKRPPSYNNDMKRPVIEPPSRFHPTISKDLDAIILRMVDLDPEKRYTSVLELIPDIELLEDARYYY